jgi:hypothetical protein
MHAVGDCCMQRTCMVHIGIARPQAAATSSLWCPAGGQACCSWAPVSTSCARHHVLCWASNLNKAAGAVASVHSGARGWGWGKVRGADGAVAPCGALWPSFECCSESL